MALEGEQVIILSGDIDLTRSDDLSVEIETKIEIDGITGLVLDMTELTFLDSTGISLLLKARQLANEQGVTLTLKNPPHQTRRLLHLAGVAEFFTVDPP